MRVCIAATIYARVCALTSGKLRLRVGRTSFIPESTETHFMDVSLFSIEDDVPGNASAKSRTRTRRRVAGSRMTTASAEGYI